MRPLPLAGAVFLLLQSSILAQDSGVNQQDVVKIEEYWELVVREPDLGAVAPQVACSFAPTRQGGCLFATFNLNHRVVGQDDFGAGGLQLQLWHGEKLLASKTSDKHQLLGKPGEAITWTQVMSLKDGAITFAIENGKSETWGPFGASLSLSLKSELTSLNEYQPNDSLDHSGAVFAGNRVTSLKLSKVRATYRSGETKTAVATPIAN